MKNKEACDVGYIWADAQVRQSVWYVVEIFNTGLTIMGLYLTCKSAYMKRKQHCKGIGVRECGSIHDKQDYG